MAKNVGKQIVARRYAHALFELAAGSNQIEAVERDLASLCHWITMSEDLDKTIHSPIIAKSELKDVMKALAKQGSMSPLMTNFCRTLAENRRLALLPAINQAFIHYASENRGEITAEITTAKPLLAKERKQLVSSLSQSTGKKVQVLENINEDILGGVVVKIGSKMMDNSLASHLEQMKHYLKTSTS